VCVCLSVTRFRTIVDSVVAWLRLKILIASDAEESLFLSWLITSAPFSLLLAGRSTAVTHWTSMPLGLWRKYDFETLIHLLLDRAYYFNVWQVLHRLYVWLTACLRSFVDLERRKCRPTEKVKLKFSLGTSESEADERYLLIDFTGLRRAICFPWVRTILYRKKNEYESYILPVSTKVRNKEWCPQFQSRDEWIGSWWMLLVY
jgi:hypothetical protein